MDFSVAFNVWNTNIRSYIIFFVLLDVTQIPMLKSMQSLHTPVWAILDISAFHPIKRRLDSLNVNEVIQKGVGRISWYLTTTKHAKTNQSS